MSALAADRHVNNPLPHPVIGGFFFLENGHQEVTPPKVICGNHSMLLVPRGKQLSKEGGGEEMKSLHTRLDPRKDEVLRITGTFGQFKGMREAGVASYDCFRRWLKEVTGDENFGLHPKIKLAGDQTLGDQCVEAFLRKVAYLETRNAEKDRRIEYLEWQLSLGQPKQLQQALTVLEVCQV